MNNKYKIGVSDMKKNENLVFDELTEEDKKEYKELGKKSLKIRLIIFLISILEFLLYTYELYKENHIF